MAFYNPKRSKSWNYGGDKWRLSRSKIDLFLECQKCFYLDNKLGTKRPPGFPFNLNSAVDALLKKEFDIHRRAQTPHPLMVKFGIDAVPFEHKDIDTWRENFEGVEAFYEEGGFYVSGAVDDVWVNTSGELHVVDYKSTSKDEEVTLDAEWQNGYKRQMEVYQWLLRKNGFKVSNMGYFVYANARKDKDTFEGKLEFRMKIIPYDGDDSWVDGAIRDAKECLGRNTIPGSSNTCEYCAYRDAITDSERDITGSEKQNKDVDRRTLF
ncbi:hypothetical protein COW81_01170 [Candidatus Campbellbacteria bacterium CG22_combo_CG10-13_8_21_14_all_36_13]|uniref:PD-(D/E)XK endonuclease-like domain-containing protein n=1 Tax=Candidatus Campbellbacteria bacterium CG22_combo_CG10-13_8_21_14_all_36_13 TaxID=1974529 RepID=A0A2H0E098_9BACT|nr:MAG: hypothetical protein COW81_01170 [Candidatus Campbellbacteria bacterium CG22_combo_CG10-13_8_21_14_all_36_13]